MKLSINIEHSHYKYYMLIYNSYILICNARQVGKFSDGQYIIKWIKSYKMEYMQYT